VLFESNKKKKEEKECKEYHQVLDQKQLEDAALNQAIFKTAIAAAVLGGISLLAGGVKTYWKFQVDALKNRLELLEKQKIPEAKEELNAAKEAKTAAEESDERSAAAVAEEKEKANAAKARADGTTAAEDEAQVTFDAAQARLEAAEANEAAASAAAAAANAAAAAAEAAASTADEVEEGLVEAAAAQGELDPFADAGEAAGAVTAAALNAEATAARELAAQRDAEAEEATEALSSAEEAAEEAEGELTTAKRSNAEAQREYGAAKEELVAAEERQEDVSAELREARRAYNEAMAKYDKLITEKTTDRTQLFSDTTSLNRSTAALAAAGFLTGVTGAVSGALKLAEGAVSGEVKAWQTKIKRHCGDEIGKPSVNNTFESRFWDTREIVANVDSTWIDENSSSIAALTDAFNLKATNYRELKLKASLDPSDSKSKALETARSEFMSVSREITDLFTITAQFVDSYDRSVGSMAYSKLPHFVDNENLSSLLKVASHEEIYADAVDLASPRTIKENFNNQLLNLDDNPNQIIIEANTSGVSANLGDGNNKFTGNSSFDSAVAGSGNDELIGNGGQDYLYGGGGNDKITGGNGRDLLIGDSGNDVLHGGNARDLLYGGSGNDTLYGENSDDFISGGDGKDYLFGGAGNDFLKAGSGTNYLTGGEGRDFYEVAINGYAVINDYVAKDDLIRFSGVTQENELYAFYDGVDTNIYYLSSLIATISGVQYSI